jgi:hypothetical protein
MDMASMGIMFLSLLKKSFLKIFNIIFLKTKVWIKLLKAVSNLQWNKHFKKLLKICYNLELISCSQEVLPAWCMLKKLVYIVPIWETVELFYSRERTMMVSGNLNNGIINNFQLIIKLRINEKQSEYKWMVAEYFHTEMKTVNRWAHLGYG